MEENRPNPDEMLRKIKKEENAPKRGKLKIFFGYAAGVGKTYAMLDAAHAAQNAGADVVVGYIEPHTRPETMALLDGMEVLPLKEIPYRGIQLREFDLDAALRRKPELILVDELAHTDAAGCRHTKRYNDIEELLNAGISVYTTVNVQHLESLNDIVASITRVHVRETIPDSVFDDADQIELVDIEPEELIDRLSQGKIYRQNQAKRALSHFFSKDNLVALREIALRRAADRVNRQVESIRIETKNEYHTGEHVLVCLSSSPSNAKVIRAAARFVSTFHASFTALFVETPHTTELNDKNRAMLRKNLKLAEQLGAKIATVYGSDIPLQISEFARLNGISIIIMGHSNNRRRLFSPNITFVERLTSLAPNLDVYIIPDSAPPRRSERSRWSLRTKLNKRDCARSLAVVTACTLLAWLFYALGFSNTNMIIVYIFGVLVISSTTYSRIYGIAASVLSVLLVNFLFTEPRFTLQAYGPDAPLTFAIMFTASLITNSITGRMKYQTKLSSINAHRTNILLETSRQLQRANRMDEIIRKSSEQLSRLLSKSIVFYPVKDGKLQQPAVYPADPDHPVEDSALSPAEQAVAAWVYKNKKSAGVGTDTLPGAKALYMPVKNKGEVLAVIGILIQSRNQIEILERSLLSGMIGEISSAIEKYNLNESQRLIAMQAEKESLRANLLRAISHDLRTPLTSITGNANLILSDGDNIDTDVKHKLIEDIYDDSLWLINLVENLLAVTRIEDGRLSIKLQPELVQDLISEALQHINKKSAEHKISVKMQDDLLMARVDPHLVMQVIINIVNNAIQYTPAGSEICLAAFRRDDSAVIEIADNGGGIPDDDKKQIFDMFYTAGNESGDSRRGLGIGLSLCKSIVLAHGGKIYVRDNKPSGTVFGFTLQIEEMQDDGMEVDSGSGRRPVNPESD